MCIRDSGATVGDRAGHARERVPDARPSAVDVGGALDLVRRSGRAPGEVRGELLAVEAHDVRPPSRSRSGATRASTRTSGMTAVLSSKCTGRGPVSDLPGIEPVLRCGDQGLELVPELLGELNPGGPEQAVEATLLADPDDGETH